MSQLCASNISFNTPCPVLREPFSPLLHSCHSTKQESLPSWYWKCQLQIGTCQEHLLVGHLPSAAAETKPCAAAAVDLQHPLREFRVE